jgi:hypothetical protein
VGKRDDGRAARVLHPRFRPSVVGGYFALNPDLIQASLFTPSGGVVCSGG